MADGGMYHIFKTWPLGGGVAKEQALVVFEEIPRVRENNAVAHFSRGTRGIMVDRRLQDLLDRDEAGKLGGRGKDRVKDSTCKLGALSVQPFVLSRQRGYRACGEAGKTLRELVVQPHEEEVASEPGEGGEEGGGGLHQVHLRQRGHGGRGQRTQLLSVALCHPRHRYGVGHLSGESCNR